jgi:transposase
LGPETPRARVAIEACREAWHVHDVLTSWGHQVLLVDTTRSRQLGIGRHGRKNDRIDAEVLARAVECDRIPCAHVLSPHRRQLREMLLTRRALVGTRANLITTVRGIVRARGESLGSCSTEDFRKKVQRAKLTEATRGAIAPLVNLLTPLDAELARVDTELEALCAQEPVIVPLTTAPGVGLIVAAAFVSVVDEAKRFRHAHQLESYLGLVPAEDTSGGRDNRRLGAITKCGNSYLRALLVQASWCILRGRKADPLRTWGNQIAKRRGKRIAVIAVARRLAGVLWAMWRHGRVYDPARLGGASARGLRGAAARTDANAQAIKRASAKAASRARIIRLRQQEVTATS